MALRLKVLVYAVLIYHEYQFLLAEDAAAANSTGVTGSNLTTLKQTVTKTSPGIEAASVLTKNTRNGSHATTKNRIAGHMTSTARKRPALKSAKASKITKKIADKHALRYGFQKTKECKDYEKVFLCVRKCLDYGFDVGYADKKCHCKCFKIKEKGMYTTPRKHNTTKWKLGIPTTAKPIWAQPETQKPDPDDPFNPDNNKDPEPTPQDHDNEHHDDETTSEPHPDENEPTPGAGGDPTGEGPDTANPADGTGTSTADANGESVNTTTADPNAEPGAKTTTTPAAETTTTPAGEQ